MAASGDLQNQEKQSDIMQNGKFIVFEGIECCGKSTQAKELYDTLQKRGDKTILTEEQWEEDEIGKLIKRELADKADQISVMTLQFLFVANRSNHLEKLIEPNIKNGTTVISDRYWMSSVAYGSAFAEDKTMEREYLLGINRRFRIPDIVFYVDVEPETAYQRLENKRIKNGEEVKRERFDKLESLAKLRDSYLKLEKVYEGLWITIDGRKDREYITKNIIEHYDKLFSAQK